MKGRIDMRETNQKRNRIIAILTVVILSIGMVIMPLTVSASGVNASDWRHFSMLLSSVDEGYNSSVQYKHPPFPLFWVDYQYCSYGANYPVNFLVIADSNSVQISNNIIINSTGQNGYTTYYSPNHDGYVRLRANTGSYQAGYAIMGEWAPNAFYCGD